MQTSNALLLDIVGASRTRFVIPPYQRAYSWKRRQCEELWLDIFRAARSASQHFVGTLLYAPERNDENGNARFSIVDGQQRTTTVSLILVALVRHLKNTGITLAHTTVRRNRGALPFARRQFEPSRQARALPRRPRLLLRRAARRQARRYRLREHRAQPRVLH